MVEALITTAVLVAVGAGILQLESNLLFSALYPASLCPMARGLPVRYATAAYWKWLSVIEKWILVHHAYSYGNNRSIVQYASI